MRLAINPQPIKPLLPKPPFVIRLSSPDDWYKLLDAHPELEDKYRWASGIPLSSFTSRNQYRFFDENNRVTHSSNINGKHEHWPLVEFPQ